MERRKFLLSLGWVAVGSFLPLRSQVSGWMGGKPKQTAACWLTPEETEGPFYFDPNLVRQDITEGKPGVPLHLTLNVVDENCTPLPNVLVDVWHTDKNGLYSGYGNTSGQTFMRGTQLSDAEGKVRFETIYPGWYPGRATHIHFKARTSQATYVTSQFAFPDGVNDAVYATELYADRGSNPISNAEDGIFRNATPQHLLLTVAPDGQGGQNGTFTMGISGPTPNQRNTWGQIKDQYPRGTM